MRTRRGLCYPRVIATTSSNIMCKSDKGVVGGYCSDDNIGIAKRMKNDMMMENESFVARKRRKRSPETAATDAADGGGNLFFDSLPDDLVLTILAKLSSSATCPSDFVNVLITYVTIPCLLYILGVSQSFRGLVFKAKKKKRQK